MLRGRPTLDPTPSAKSQRDEPSKFSHTNTSGQTNITRDKYENPVSNGQLVQSSQHASSVGTAKLLRHPLAQPCRPPKRPPRPLQPINTRRTKSRYRHSSSLEAQRKRASRCRKHCPPHGRHASTLPILILQRTANNSISGLAYRRNRFIFCTESRLYDRIV